MKCYRLSYTKEGPFTYHGTIAEVKDVTRAMPVHQRNVGFVDEIDVKTDKLSIITLLNQGDLGELSISKTWIITLRGSLKAMENGS